MFQQLYGIMACFIVYFIYRKRLKIDNIYQLIVWLNNIQYLLFKNPLAIWKNQTETSANDTDLFTSIKADLQTKIRRDFHNDLLQQEPLKILSNLLLKCQRHHLNRERIFTTMFSNFLGIIIFSTFSYMVMKSVSQTPFILFMPQTRFLLFLIILSLGKIILFRTTVPRYWLFEKNSYSKEGLSVIESLFNKNHTPSELILLEAEIERKHEIFCKKIEQLQPLRIIVDFAVNFSAVTLQLTPLLLHISHKLS